MSVLFLLDLSPLLNLCSYGSSYCDEFPLLKLVLPVQFLVGDVLVVFMRLDLAEINVVSKCVTSGINIRCKKDENDTILFLKAIEKNISN